MKEWVLRTNKEILEYKSNKKYKIVLRKDKKKYGQKTYKGKVFENDEQIEIFTKRTKDCYKMELFHIIDDLLEDKEKIIITIEKGY